MDSPKKKAERVLGKLREGSESIARNPSEANYRNWENQIESASKDDNSLLWIIAAVVIVAISFGLFSLVSNSDDVPSSGASQTYNSQSSSTNHNSANTSASSASTFKSSPTPRPSRPTRTPMPTPTTFICGVLRPRLEVGELGIVKYDPPIRNRVRSSPGLSGSQIGTIDPGEQFRVLDGPVCANDITWWKVDPNRGPTGWTAEGEAEYYLAPR
jgi:hypothetical protein